MRSLSTAFNTTTVILLAAILLAVLLLPRFNYEALVKRQDMVSDQTRELIGQWAVVRAGSDEQTAIVSRVMETVTDLRSDYQSLLTRLSALEKEWADLQIAQISQTAQSKSADEKRPSLETFYASATQHEIDLGKILPKNILKDVNKYMVSVKVLTQDGFEHFLEVVLKTKLLPYDSAAEIPEPVLRSLTEQYESHTALLKLLDVEQRQEIQRIVKEDLAANNYVDLPSGQAPSSSGPGVLHVVNIPELGVNRVFDLNPQHAPSLLEHEKTVKNVRDHLIKDVYELSEKEAQEH
jgi:hypothetical protein